jgi:hypothetical protein
MPSILHDATKDLLKDIQDEKSIFTRLMTEEVKNPGNIKSYIESLVTLRLITKEFTQVGYPEPFVLFLLGYVLGQIRAKDETKRDSFELPGGIVKENGRLKFANTNASLKSLIIGANFPVISDEQERILMEFLVKLIESVERS